MSWTIKLPWPSWELWENRKANWKELAGAKARARKYAWVVAKEAKVPKLPNAILRFTFHPPTRSNPDVQNLPGTQKAFIDGIADAMGCDDRGFRPQFPDHLGEKRQRGCVMVEILEG